MSKMAKALKTAPSNRFVLVSLTVLLLVGFGLAVAFRALSKDGPPHAAGSFTFAAAGDFGSGDEFKGTLRQIKAHQADFALALGDFSYGHASERAWCRTVTDVLGATFPFQLLVGNHDDRGSSDMEEFATCLPNRMSEMVGEYGRQYYFDYADLARVIALSPDVEMYGKTYMYAKGSEPYKWAERQIDGARAAGLDWVVVATHENCLTAGVKSCEIGTDLHDLLLSKRVDLVLQGHEHAYMRSKQLTTNGQCPQVRPGAYKPACVLESQNGSFKKGAGPVLVINGAGGIPMRNLNLQHRDRPFFEDLHAENHHPLHGPSIFKVTKDRLDAVFVDDFGKTQDAFTILRK